ncbi:hypothetical protein Q1695_016109 [Nippostrongylus brasiliensis]|nr:hypothetical protein Q1695_016109 [Nippostrongylus brasiliensis]
MPKKPEPTTPSKGQPKSDNSQKSIRNGCGENLERLTDMEWEKGTTAKPAELLNVEKNPNAVTVFVGPKEIIERPERRIGSKEKTSEKEETDPIVELVNRVAKMVTSRRDDAQAEVSVTVTVKPKAKLTEGAKDFKETPEKAKKSART